MRAAGVTGRSSHGLLFRERIGLAALLEITRRYLSGQPAYRVELVDVVVARGILVRATEAESVIFSHPSMRGRRGRARTPFLTFSAGATRLFGMRSAA